MREVIEIPELTRHGGANRVLSNAMGEGGTGAIGCDGRQSVAQNRYRGATTRTSAATERAGVE